jgi:hypothetical protein
MRTSSVEYPFMGILGVVSHLGPQSLDVPTSHEPKGLPVRFLQGCENYEKDVCHKGKPKTGQIGYRK